MELENKIKTDDRLKCSLNTIGPKLKYNKNIKNDITLLLFLFCLEYIGNFTFSYCLSWILCKIKKLI